MAVVDPAQHHDLRSVAGVWSESPPVADCDRLIVIETPDDRQSSTFPGICAALPSPAKIDGQYCDIDHFLTVGDDVFPAYSRAMRPQQDGHDGRPSPLSLSALPFLPRSRSGDTPFIGRVRQERPEGR